MQLAHSSPAQYLPRLWQADGNDSEEAESHFHWNLAQVPLVKLHLMVGSDELQDGTSNNELQPVKIHIEVIEDYPERKATAGAPILQGKLSYEQSVMIASYPTTCDMIESFPTGSEYSFSTSLFSMWA